MSGNPGDFALAFSAGTGETYRICVYGDFTECTVIITGYTGDGSSLTRDDVEPLPEPEGEPAEGTDEQGSDDPAAETPDTEAPAAEEEAGEAETVE